MKKAIGFLTIFLFFNSLSCNYLDIVPDNVASIDNAFSTWTQAKKYLFTCYSYMPLNGQLDNDPAILGGDEIWLDRERGIVRAPYSIALGFQNIVSSYAGKWGSMYKAIRDCNIFLGNIETVPDLDEVEKTRWIGEVKFLKAFYYFWLVKMYGPVPLVKENKPINSSPQEVDVSRDPVDSCFNYIVELIDEAIPDLPLTVPIPAEEAGRITKPIALSFKAKVLVYAASPLFNGDTQEKTLKNNDGTELFNTIYSKEKWETAAVACKAAIDICESVNMSLYKFGNFYNQFTLTDTIRTQLSLRNAFNSPWNSGIIWANTQYFDDFLQGNTLPRIDPSNMVSLVPRGEMSPPLKIAEMFYTQHGVPIDEDKTWDYKDRYELRVAKDSDALYIRKGYFTASLNFDRGPRFYAYLGFDGGVWYGQGVYDDSKPTDLFYVEAKFGQKDGIRKGENSVTGYFLKKLVNFENVVGEGNSNYTVNPYPYPIIRLSGLYLLYSEALNEAKGPGVDVYYYLNLVRNHAGLPDVQIAWDNYAIDPTEYKNKEGLRKIIHRERLIELCFEGQRFWDLRRWKTASSVMNEPIRGFAVQDKEGMDYYNPVTIFDQKFGLKDYFWPIKESILTDNKNIVQNIGW